MLTYVLKTIVKEIKTKKNCLSFVHFIYYNFKS